MDSPHSIDQEIAPSRTRLRGRRLVGVRGLASYLGISVHTVYSWVAQHRVPFMKVGRLLRFDLDVIDRWLERHSVVDDGTMALERDAPERIIARSCGTRPEGR